MDKYNNEDLNTISNKAWEELSLAVINKNKNIEKIFDAAKVIKEIDADVYSLQEVGGVSSLENFNKYFLNDEYKVCFRESNSKRGIDIGFLVNKKFSTKVIGNNKMKLENGSSFSRNRT